MVNGGQQPVSGATIQLWAAGSTGYGTGATALISATLTTSDGTGVVNSNANAGNVNNTLAAGNFTLNFAGAYTCPTASTLVYLTATGGNPGLAAGTNNSAIVLMAPLGQCGSLNSSTFVSINEVTTVASMYALAQFIGTGGSIGSPSASAPALASAFANVNNMVNIAAGSALATTSGGNTVPQSEIDTLADILVPCVNSSGPTSAACAALFSAATPSGGSAPTTVLGAVLNIALNPNINATALYNLSTANTAFQPTLSSAPANWNVIIGGGASSTCGYSGSGYTVSGTVNYSGTRTGRIFLGLTGTSSCLSGTQGTSLPSKGAYTIRGVPPGTYTLFATMDTQGYGAYNSADPIGNSTVTVSTANLAGQNVTMSDPSPVTLTSAPGINAISPFNTGVIVSFNPIEDAYTMEAATSYTLEWSTTSSFTTVAGSKTFPAAGKHSATLWLLKGLTDGSVYYFRAYGTSAGTPGSPVSATYGPVTIGAPSSGSTVAGSVSFSGAATGPMYVGLFNESTGAAYLQYISNPVSMQAYSVAVPNNANLVYSPFAIIDQNNDGVVDAGDIQDANIPQAIISVTAATANVNITLPSGNSTARVTTQHTQTGSSPSYAVQFGVQYLTKLPVAVTLESSSNSDGANVVGPMDIAVCGFANSCGLGFWIGFNFGTTSLIAGDTYFFNVTYSDGTSETVTTPVTGVANSFATDLAPTTGTSTTPTFSWTNPACGPCSSYYYQFSLSGPSGTIWYVPNSQVVFLPYTTTSLTWGVDPTAPLGNAPSVSALTLGTNYTWQIGIFDNNGNEAITQVNYQP